MLSRSLIVSGLLLCPAAARVKQSLVRYAIEAGDITEKVYRKEMETPIEDMRRFLDGLYHLYDQGRDKVKMGDLLNISVEARERLNEQRSVAP